MKTHRFLKYHPQDWSCDSKSKWHCCDTVKLFQTSPHWQRVHLVFKAYHHILSYLNISNISVHSFYISPRTKTQVLVGQQTIQFHKFPNLQRLVEKPGVPSLRETFPTTSTCLLVRLFWLPLSHLHVTGTIYGKGGVVRPERKTCFFCGIHMNQWKKNI